MFITGDHALLILWLRALALACPPCGLVVPLDDLVELVGTHRPRAQA